MAFTRSGVRSPSPPSGTLKSPKPLPFGSAGHAGIAQLVEHNLAKVGVAGSSPVSRSERVSDAGWSSLVARRAHNPEVVGSNPTPATTRRVDSPGLGVWRLGRLAQLVRAP